MKISRIILCILLLSSTFYISLLTSRKVYAAANGLVGYWSLDEGSGYVAHDTSGNGNNGNLVGTPSWVNGVNGTAVHFDGVDQYIEVPNSNTLNNANFTIAAWIYLDADVGNTQARIVSKQQTNEYSYSMEIFGKGYGGINGALVANGNQLNFAIGTGSTWYNVMSNTYISNRTWYFVAGTQNGTMSKIYVNGTLDRFKDTATQTISNSGVLTIGCANPSGAGPEYFFGGIIDEVRIYNTALSQQDIITVMDLTPPLIGNVYQQPTNQTRVLPTDQVIGYANVTDDLTGVKEAVLNYTTGNGTWFTAQMVNIAGDQYNATIPPFPYGTNVTYVVTAEDGAGNINSTQLMGLTYAYSVIPEFPSFLILLLFMIATLLAVIVYKKKGVKPNQS
jgi:hypothetical protein